MKFSNDKIFNRYELSTNLSTKYNNNCPKYNSITSLKENSKQVINLNPDEEYYLIQNKKNQIPQMKSVSFKQNKKLFQNNGFFSGKTLNTLMNQYLKYSIHKNNKTKKIKNKKEENKDNKECNINKKCPKQIYMENLIKKGVLADIKNIKKVKKKTLKDKLTQKKKDFLYDLGIGYGSVNSSQEDNKDNIRNNNDYNYRYERNNRNYYNTLNNFYSTNSRRIKYYSPNNININTNYHFNSNDFNQEKEKKQIKKPKINQFEYIQKIKKEINKIKTEPNNYLSVQANSPKSVLNHKILSPKLTTILNDSFRHNKKQKRKKVYSNPHSNKSKEKKINLKRFGKKLINLNIKTKAEYFQDKRKTHRSPEELYYYIKNKKIMRKKKEVKNIDKKDKDLFHKYKNLCTLNNNFSPKNNHKSTTRQHFKCYSPKYYNTISTITTYFHNKTKKKINNNSNNINNNNPKILLENESKKNLNSTLIDANEYYINILDSKNLIRNHIYNKTEFNFYRKKYQNKETKDNKEENNLKNILRQNKYKDKRNNKDMIKKISKKIVDMLIKAKIVFSEEKNIDNEKEKEKEEEKNNIKDKTNLENENIVKEDSNNKKNLLNKEPIKLIQEHNNKIQFLYDNENKNEKNNNIKNIEDKKEKINEEEEIQKIDNIIINQEEKENLNTSKKKLNKIVESENKEENKNEKENEDNIDCIDIKEESKIENNIINSPIINNYIKDKEENKNNIKKEIDPNQITKIEKIIINSFKRYAFSIMYTYYIQIVIIENYFIGIKYIIAICKKYAFMKLKRNLFNHQIFTALKKLINPFKNKIFLDFFNILKQIPTKKNENVIIPKTNNNIDISFEEINQDNKNDILNLNDVFLEDKNKNKDCPNTIINNNINQKENKIEENKIQIEIESQNTNENENEINKKIENNNIIKEEKKILNEKIIDDLTEEILQKILLTELTSKDILLIPKKKFKYKTKLINIKSNSSSNSTDNITKDNKKLNLNNLSNISSLSEESLSALNDSIMEAYTQKSFFFKTILDKKKFYLIKFYQRKIAPKMIDLIKQEIILKYDRIYNNISKPYENNSKEIMVSLILQDAELLRDNFKVQGYEETIADIMDKENLLKKFKVINKKIREDYQKNELKKTNPKSSNEFPDNYLKIDQHLNKCLIDCAIELINSERKYGENGNPLIWSSRHRELVYKYPKKDPTKLVNFISKNLYKYLNQKNGLICENYEYLPGDIISAEREKRLIKTIKTELEDGDYLWRNLEMEETQLKVEVSDSIIEQLYNEVVEIMEHIQLSRNKGELYHYKSIYACDEMPKLSFQQTTTTENAEGEENNNDNILFNNV